jgi:hypothetical protein
MIEFHADTIKGVAKHVRRMLGSVRRAKSGYELGLALAAAKIVTATLQKAADEAGIPDEVKRAGDEMAANAQEVMDLVRW